MKGPYSTSSSSCGTTEEKPSRLQLDDAGNKADRIPTALTFPRPSESTTWKIQIGGQFLINNDPPIAISLLP